MPPDVKSAMEEQNMLQGTVNSTTVGKSHAGAQAEAPRPSIEEMEYSVRLQIGIKALAQLCLRITHKVMNEQAEVCMHVSMSCCCDDACCSHDAPALHSVMEYIIRCVRMYACVAGTLG